MCRVTIGGRRCLAIGEPEAKTELSTRRRLQAPTRHRCVGVPPVSGSVSPAQYICSTIACYVLFFRQIYIFVVAAQNETPGRVDS